MSPRLHHHRVKNNFEIISSILDLASMDTENQEVKDIILSSRTRIHAMASIHTQLYQSDLFNRIEMAKHVRNFTEHLQYLYDSGNKITVVTEPSDVYLSLNQAIPCALIFNELITNSLKYGFENREQGTILISIHNTDDDKVLLRVKDDGVGIPGDPDIESTSGFGLELVKHLAMGQLKGTMQISNHDGTNISIEFKRLK